MRIRYPHIQIPEGKGSDVVISKDSDDSESDSEVGDEEESDEEVDN